MAQPSPQTIFLLHPAIPFILTTALLVLTLGFTKARSTYRPALLPLLAILVIYSSRTTDRASSPQTNPMISCLLGGATGGLVLHFIDHALLSAWGFEEQGPTSSAGGLRPISPVSVDHGDTMGATTTRRLSAGLAETFRLRGVGTRWKVKNVPPFRGGSPGYVPPKRAFLASLLWRLAVYVAVLDLVSLAPPPDSSSVDFAPTRVPLFARWAEVDGPELLTRTAAVLGHWGTMYCMIQMWYSAFAVLALLAGVTDVDVWRPLFGELRDCWSVRNFWGSFWHQSVRQSFLGPANFITDSVLRLRKGSLIARYTRIIAVFVCSGLYHIQIDMSYGIPPRSSGALRFFSSQALAIIFEDIIRFAYSTAFRGLSGKARDLEAYEKLLGYAWTALWLIWSTPAISYPMAQKNVQAGPSRILPFSPIRIVLGRFED